MSNARRRWERFKRSQFAEDLQVFTFGVVCAGTILAADFYARTH